MPPADYWPKVRALLDKYDILLIDDEVMAGFGRTGKWFATQHYGIKPDMITFAKGVSSSLMPLGGVIVNRRISDFMEDHMLWTGLTGAGHPVCCAAGIACMDVYVEEKIFENVEKQGAYLAERLEAMKATHACVGDVRYIGLFSMVELVKDKATKEPLAPYGGTSPEMGTLRRLPAQQAPVHVLALQRVLHRAAAGHHRGGAEVRSGHRGRGPDARWIEALGA